jgi:hypothetical protein
MVCWPAERERLHAFKPECCQVQAIDEDIDRPNRIVIADVVIENGREQCALRMIQTLYEPRHCLAPSIQQVNHTV